MLLKGKRIFYVEDSLENRALAQLILERNGAKMEFERWGGASAVLRLKAFLPVDLILMDLVLPDGVSGYQVFDSIRADAQFNAIPIAVVSSADITTELPKVQARGFVGYIPKPISAATFPQYVNDLIHGKAVWVTAVVK